MGYAVNGVEYDTWSATNQRILDRLIDREVYCCMTSEVEYMLSRIPYGDDDNPFDESDEYQCIRTYCPECDSSDGFTELTVGELDDEDFQKGMGYIDDSDELEEGYICPVCGLVYHTIQEARDCCGEDEVVYKCDSCGRVFNEDEYDRLDTRYEEVFEWWAVSHWFGEKLEEQGCVVIESWGKSYWGRQTTGQAISLDGCVINIAKNMQILEGMENDWSKMI